MIKTTMVTILLSLNTLTGTAQTVGTGSISGTAVNDANQALPDATIVYTKLPVYTPGKDGRMATRDSGFTRSLTAGPGGTFVISGLSPGQYDVCAYGPRSNQVSGCDWDGGAATVLGDAQTITNLTRRVYDAATITFRVSDPNGRIATPDAHGNVPAERRFSLGVSQPSGFYHRATLVSRGTVQSVFAIAIPKQRTVHLFIDSALSVLFSGSDQPINNAAPGTPVETGKPATLQISPGSRDQITFNLLVQ